MALNILNRMNFVHFLQQQNDFNFTFVHLREQYVHRLKRRGVASVIAASIFHMICIECHMNLHYFKIELLIFDQIEFIGPFKTIYMLH